MANSIIGIIVPNQSLKITSDTTGEVSLLGLGVSVANLRLMSKILKNQREDGVIIAHGRVIIPSVIELDVIVQTIDGLETLNQIYKDIEGLYTIVSRGISFTNMRMTTQGIQQSAEMLSASPIRLTFKQAFLQNDDMPICQQAPDSSLIDTGIADLKNFSSDVTTFIGDNITPLFQ